MRHAVLAVPMKLVFLALGSSIALLLTASPAIAQCSSDAYEPDDTVFGSKTFITDGETQHHNFCDDSIDWVNFSACGGRTYSITTFNLGEQADTFLEIYSPDGTMVLTNDDDGNGGLASRVVWTAASAGTYHIKVRQTDNSYGFYREFDLQLKGNTSACDLWTYSTGGAQWDESVALIQRQDGEVLAVGRTESYSFPYSFVWSVTLNMDGTAADKRVSGFGLDVSHAVAQDLTGRFVLVGESNYRYLSPSRDSLVVYESFGGSGPSARLLVGGPSDDYSNSIAILGDGSYVVAGSTLSSGAGGLDAWLYRVDAGGATVTWQETIGGSGNEEVYSVLANANGDITVSGYTTSFGAGQKDGLVARLDSSGSLLWSRVIGGAGSDEFRKTFETPDGGLLVVGTSTGPTFVVAADIWLVKLDGQGQVLWEKTIGGGGDDRVLGAMHVSDGYVIAGYTDSAAVGNYDGLLMKVDTNGDPVWTRTYGGAETDRLYDVIEAIDGSLVAAGYTKSFGASLADAWILKTALDGANGSSCNSTTPPPMTVQPRSRSVTDPHLTAVGMVGSSVYIGGGSNSVGSPDNLQCHILAPTEVSGPTTLAPLVFTSHDDLSWEDRAVNHADSFNLYRGELAGLPFGDSGSCLGTVPSNAYSDPDAPGYGTGWFYLVTGRNALGEGPMGTNSAGVSRVNANPCP